MMKELNKIGWAINNGVDSSQIPNDSAIDVCRNDGVQIMRFMNCRW